MRKNIGDLVFLEDSKYHNDTDSSRQGIVSTAGSNHWPARLVGALLGTLLGIGASYQPVFAGTVVSFKSPVTIKAREQPVDKFLQTLFSEIDVPVVVHEHITGTVNSDFAKPAAEIFNDIASSFQLALYYDGAVAHVYSASDVSYTILYLSQETAKRVVAHAEKLSLVDRHNTLKRTELGLIVTGVPRFVTQVRELTKALKPKNSKYMPPTVMRVFRLKYASAADSLQLAGGRQISIPGVASLLRSLINPDSQSNSAKITHVPENPALPGLLDQHQPQNQNTPGLQTVGQKPTSAESMASVAAANGANVVQQAVIVPGGGARIVADPMNNAVIISDRADHMANYEQLIKTLDVESSMIAIEATIIDMNTDRLLELGVDWRLQRDNATVTVGTGLANSSLLPPGAGRITPLEGGAAQLVLGNPAEFLARIRALETQGAARIVSKPHVSTLPNVEALLEAGNEFYLRTQGVEDGDVVPVPAVTALQVTPRIIDDGGKKKIRLVVKISDDILTDRLIDQIPVTQKSSLGTQAVINVGESLLIGGMVRDVKTNSVSKVPLLGSIPFFGALFRTNTKSTSHMERMFLITPRLKFSQDKAMRYDGPILSGTEEEIIESSRSRMQPTEAGLSKLDMRISQPDPLPKGTGTVSIQTSNAPFDAIKHPDRQQQANALTLRNRILLMQEGLMVAKPLPSAPVPGPGTVDPAYPNGVLDSQLPSIASGWQKVPRLSSHPSVDGADDSIPVIATDLRQQVRPSEDSPDVSTDNWQRVPMAKSDTELLQSAD